MIYSEYQKAYEGLKKSEEWSRVIEISLQALQDQNLKPSQKALIYARMASSYFYLANYDMAEQAAENARINASAESDANHDLFVRSLYLLSAVHRAKGDKEKALEYIDYAFIMLDSPFLTMISDLNRGKVYFNAGALKQDLFHDNEKAIALYRESMRYFVQNSDDYLRASMRYIRLMIAQDPATAAKQLEEIKPQIDLKTKTGVHFAILHARVCIGLHDNAKAVAVIDAAMQIAGAKHMQKELEIMAEVRFYAHLQRQLDNYSLHQTLNNLTPVLQQMFASLYAHAFVSTDTIGNELKPHYSIMQSWIEQALQASANQTECKALKSEAGAVYKVDNLCVLIESKQADAQEQNWAITVGKKAATKAKQLYPDLAL